MDPVGPCSLVSPWRRLDLWVCMAGDEHCPPLWEQGLVWPPAILFVSFSELLCLPAQSVKGTPELSRRHGFWDQGSVGRALPTPPLFSSSSFKRAESDLSTDGRAGA